MFLSVGFNSKVFLSDIIRAIFLIKTYISAHDVFLEQPSSGTLKIER